MPQVNETDLRQKASDCSIKDEDILNCIGKITSHFRNKSQLNATGTVFKVVDSYAYVITAAQSLRLTEYKCNKCQCTMRGKKQRSSCRSCSSKDFTINVVKANKIYFQRRKLDNGALEHEYSCDVNAVYIDDTEYCKHPYCKSGSDIAVFKFKDFDNYYSSLCKNILLVDGKLFHSVKDKNDPYFMYGYPDKLGNTYDKPMRGGQSTNNIFECKLNTNNGKRFLQQNEIDTSDAVAGSAIFSIHNQCFLIFAVHSGGSKSCKYNVGTLVPSKIDHSTIKTEKDLANIKHRKVEMQKNLPGGVISSYISDKFQRFDQSEGSYTLNILEMILYLHVNSKPSISLIDHTLSITSMYLNKMFL
eukprot:12583_1